MEVRSESGGHEFVRNAEAWNYLESFLIAAVVAILAIRAFLAATGYPQLGSGGLHIAHMLWGGLFMLVAIALMLALLGDRVRHVGALLGGIGFGTFIDELGKFITGDNNYFFQPTIALIYIIFILLYLIFSAVSRQRALSPEEMLANAASALVDVVVGGATPREVAEGVKMLDKSGAKGPLASSIRQALLVAPQVEERPPSLLARADAQIRHGFDRLLSWRWFQRAVVAVFVVHGVVFLLLAAATIFQLGPIQARGIDARSSSAIGELLASLLSSILIAVGVIRLSSSRLDALRWFKRAIMVSVFLIQVFAFYENQLGAIFGLAADLVLLAALSYLIQEEEAKT